MVNFNAIFSVIILFSLYEHRIFGIRLRECSISLENYNDFLFLVSMLTTMKKWFITWAFTEFSLVQTTR